MVQTEAGERDEASKGFSVQVVQTVVTQTKPLDVLQALDRGFPSQISLSKN